MEGNHVEEEFFLKSVYIEHAFDIVGRTDYLFLYSIRACMEQSDIENGVYLSDLAKHMELSVPDVSKAVKSLEDKGYVTWKLDQNKERTYIVLTNKAVELGNSQKRKMVRAYEKIIQHVPKEDMDVTLRTLGTIRQMLEEEG